MTSTKKKSGNRRRKSVEPAAEQTAGRAGVAARWSELRARLGQRLQRLERPLALVGKLLSVVAVLVLTLAVGRLVEQHVRRAKAFETVAVVVDGAERLDREQVMEAAGLALGRNVFAVSSQQARQGLLRHPWIASAEVIRRLPGTYRVTIQERVAVAILALDKSYLVGDEGTVFKPLQTGDPVDLPVITGLGAAVFEADPELRAATLVSAVALLHDYRDVGLWRREPIAEIHADSEAALALYVGREVTHVRLGRRPFRRKLRRLRGVLDQLEKAGDAAAYVYLDNQRRPDRVTVRLR